MIAFHKNRKRHDALQVMPFLYEFSMLYDAFAMQRGLFHLLQENIFSSSSYFSCVMSAS